MQAQIGVDGDMPSHTHTHTQNAGEWLEHIWSSYFKILMPVLSFKM
jgi:hypothetical protein